MKKLNTISACLNWACQYMQKSKISLGQGTDNYWDEAVYAALDIFKLPLDTDDSVLEKKIKLEQSQHYQDLIIERITTKKPMAYLLGYAWYMGMKFIVNQDVLIPRSPISECILNKLKPWQNDLQPKKILEIGTGCGALAILAAKTWPSASIIATDISLKALQVAIINIKNLQCEKNISLQQSDVYAQLGREKFDIIISNPPYVCKAEWQNLPNEFKAEPKTALYASRNGLQIVIKILQQAHQYLTKNGILVMELGYTKKILERTIPKVPWQWINLKNGGSGVFIMQAKDLLDYKNYFI